MPYPRKGQTKEAYISEFVESAEAKADFPDKDQRLAVAYSLWRKHQNALENSSYGNYGEEHPWPKEYEANFIEPGIVHYQDLGACKKCGLAGACGAGQCEPTGEVVLVDNDALARMAKSFLGKPVIDKEHADVDGGTIARGEGDGIVTRVWQDEKSGWWKCRYFVWDPETQHHCESAAYSVSCAYNPTEVDSDGGTYHNMDYQQKILNGEYTHLAVVTNPRYEGARIQLVNSKDGKGGNMAGWKFWETRKNAVSLDPAKTMVTVGGKKMSLQALYNEAEKPKPEKELADDTVLEHEGKEMTLGELKQKALANMRNAEDDMKCAACNGSGKKAAENDVPGAGPADKGEAAGHKGGPEPEAKMNAEKPNPTEKPLPDMRDPKQNAQVDGHAARDQKEPATETAEKGANTTPALELRATQVDGHAARDQQDPVEDAAKKNAAEDEKKAEEERKAEERRNAAKKSFDSLRNAAHERSGPAVGVGIVSQDERLARGRAKYGKKDSVPA
jgi:hypothetical protein